MTYKKFPSPHRPYPTGPLYPNLAKPGHGRNTQSSNNKKSKLNQHWFSTNITYDIKYPDLHNFLYFVGNVLKELVEPAGAVIFCKKFALGDPSISTLELWGAEYQENNALLCRTEHRRLLQSVADRERCPVCFVGTVTGNGRVSFGIISSFWDLSL